MYNTLAAIGVYKVTKKEAELAQSAYDHRNTFEGEELYLALAESILERGGDESILYDLSADFRWGYEFHPEIKGKLDTLWERYHG